ncbi:hypothetical protein [Methylococcus mesophilus]|uniref:hypothetical protein n=1 Tax=Methylococcus mesophilus TaxID=2993564 RepID=UPI00224A660D|nr:hypothetical protein [Methylococcus mesophilus]UZR30720.1 hypothetical protein OOT43_08870 [Methylococcus mesophilus]
MAAPDFSSLIPSIDIDFHSVASAVMYVGTAIAGVLVVVRGVGLVHSAVLGKTLLYEEKPEKADDFDLTQRLKDAGYR